jgi:hypothetical protein
VAALLEEGTPQGGSASPLLANIYLHELSRIHAHLRENEKRAIHGAAADDTQAPASEVEGI